ncbi:MAG: YoeB-like toxin of bacterial type toxin-antitoxin system [Microbacteriaceae bacterium]|nr:YoeB-like toxin of bacterial type toxin-antitoxin system [Microbacteriaceae bacterium]
MVELQDCSARTSWGGQQRIQAYDRVGYVPCYEWSRRITDEHRIIYKIDGDEIRIAGRRRLGAAPGTVPLGSGVHL